MLLGTGVSYVVPDPRSVRVVIASQITTPVLLQGDGRLLFGDLSAAAAAAAVT